MTDPAITFTKDKVRALRRAYFAALDAKQEQFVFEGRDVLTAYAKYLIEYLEPHFGLTPSAPRKGAPGADL